MPQFYFHVRDDLDVTDYEGLDLPDLSAAQREAIRSARALACEQVSRGQLHLQHRVEVADEHGRIVLSVRFQDAIEIAPDGPQVAGRPLGTARRFAVNVSPLAGTSERTHPF